MTDCVLIGGLVHEVTGEHFRSFGESTEVKLDLVCGGYVTVPHNFNWRHNEPVPTCFYCIAGASKYYADFDADFDTFFIDKKILAGLT